MCSKTSSTTSTRRRPWWSRTLRRLWRDERGATITESAIALPLVTMVIVGAMQFALVYHAQGVADAAAHEGARLAAAEGRTTEEGELRALDVLRSGLGSHASDIVVEAEDSGGVVEVRVSGDYPLLIPWVFGGGVAIDATARVRSEGFRSGP